jgi:hypothetical protein
MRMPELITDEMRGIIGHPYEQQRSFPIDATAIRRWAIAVYYPEQPPREFWDPDAPEGMVAPAEFNPFAWMASENVEFQPAGPPMDPHHARPGGLEFRLGVKPPDLKTALNGGLHVTYAALMRVGDVIFGTTSIVGYTEREGRTGPILLTDIESRWSNQRDELVKISRMTMIRR